MVIDAAVPIESRLQSLPQVSDFIDLTPATTVSEVDTRFLVEIHRYTRVMLRFASYSQGSSSLCRFFISRIPNCQFCIFLHFFLISPHDTGFRNKQLYQKAWEKIQVFYFARSFRVFQLNKTEQERKVTKQTRSLLHFAPKSIKIYLVVLENELFEVVWLVPKKSQKRKHVDHTVMFYISNPKSPFF